MTKIIEYIDIPDGEVEAFKALTAKTLESAEWMKADAQRTGIKTLDAFFVELPTRTAMVVIRDPKENLDKWYASDHADDKARFEEAMEIFGMTEEDLAEMDDQLKFEHAVAYSG